jgi:hypothetical protein
MRLLWKEWQQQKWIILLGILTGISFPAIECVLVWKRSGEFRTDTGSAIVLVGGVIFSIILAIATMHHDIRKGTDIFLQSKPVSLWKFYTIKFLLASILLMLAFLAVITLDLITGYRRTDYLSFASAAFSYTYPIALALFAVSLFLMAVTRDAAKTAFLSIWAMLLVYFLPLMFRGLEWMNLFEQINNANRRPSIIQHLIWLSSLPEKITPGMAVYRPAGISESFYQMSAFQGLLHIIISPEYQRYLLFAAVFGITSIIFVLLTIKAMRYNWRWQPGQKSIVWTLGVSAAAIFGVAMFQVGHNLEPVKELNGKPLINPATYDWNYMPASLFDGLPKGYWIGNDRRYFNKHSDALCIKDDLMFRFTTGYQSNKGVDQWNERLIRHFVLQVYQFPYAEKNTASSVSVPNFVIGATKFFQTEPITGDKSQQIQGCFIRDNRLYAAYRPNSEKDKNEQYTGKANPLRFITFDISNPHTPLIVDDKIISDSNSFGGSIADIDNFSYVNDDSQLIILSVENTDKPEIIKKVTFDGVYANWSNSEVVGSKKKKIFPNGQLLIQDNKLICWNRGRITFLDITDRLNPRVVYDEFINHKYQFCNNMNDGIYAFAFQDDIAYLGTRGGIFVLALDQDKNGFYTSRLLGQRRTTPLEDLAGRFPDELLLSGNYLIEQAGSFGMLIYDISDPSKPRRVYHAQTVNFACDIGFWNGLLYLQEYNYKTTFYQLPEKNNK